MLEGLKRLFAGTRPEPPQEWDAIAPWAASRGFSFRGVQSEGFVVDGRLGATPWRLEWGPSQRPYIQGQELRLRSELGLLPELQAVLMDRTLQEQLENAVFEQYVEGVQTRIDDQTPPEMRWLVMYPRLAGAEMPQLRERYVAVASHKTWLLQWLEGALTQSLVALSGAAETPLVLMIGRGRLMLRTALPVAEVAPLQRWVRLFECAMREARRVANDSPDTISPSTSPSLWPGSTSATPGDGRKR